MSLFKNRSFNVKVVKDNKVDDKDDRTVNSMSDNIYVAEEYSRIGQEFVAGVARTVVTAVLSIMLVKTTSDIVRIVSKAAAN